MDDARLDSLRKDIVYLSDEESATWRTRFQHAFLETDSAIFQSKIGQLIEINGERYQTAFMRYAIPTGELLSRREANTFLNDYSRVIVIWDVNAVDQVYLKDYWTFGTWVAIQVSPDLLRELDPFLPEDYYVFDESLSWSVVYTHDYEAGNDEDGMQIRHIYLRTPPNPLTVQTP